MLGAFLPPLLGIFGLVAAYYIYRLIKRHPAGEAKVTGIGDQIHLGAMVFMKREFKTLGLFGIVVLALLLVFLGVETSIAFLVGALASGLAGYFGMFTATKANVRTTTAANREGAAAALTIAFFGGSVMGLLVASMGLLGLGTLYLVFGGDPETAHVIHGSAWGPHWWRCSRVSAAASSPRVRMSVPIWSARSRPAFRRTTRAIRV